MRNDRPRLGHNARGATPRTKTTHPDKPQQQKNVGKPKSASKLKGTSTPKSANKPKNASKPKSASKPENASKPKNASKPTSASKPKGASKPKNASKPKKAKPTTRGSAGFLLPHHMAFLTIYNRSGAAITRVLLDEPAEVRRQFFGSCRASPGDDAWPILKAYLDHIEERIALVVRRHSVYFWLWTYRRIGVHLHSGHPDKTDPTTIYLVRTTLESAFLKYGDLSITNDIRSSSELSDSEVLGGLVAEWLDANAPSTKSDYFALMRSMAPHHIAADFCDADLIDCYRLEGLAYEYWRTCAQMRSVGKGAYLRLSDDGPVTTVTEELEWLIRNFDRRTEASSLTASTTGVAFDPRSNGTRTLLLQYNVERRSLSDEQAAFLGFQLANGAPPNFEFAGFSLHEYLEKHRFIDNALRSSRGYGLSTVCAVLWAMVAIEAMQMGQFVPKRISQLLQRGYVLRTPDEHRDSLYTMAWSFQRHQNDEGTFCPDEWSRFTQEADQLLSNLTLTAEKQSKISLWTHGPAYIVIPYGNAQIVNLVPIAQFIKDAFLGVKFKNDGTKGTAFEDVLREWIDQSGLELLPARKLRHEDGSERETDAAVRIGDKLFLCECRSMELPLDLRISKPDKLSNRSTELLNKLVQSESLADWLRTSPKGRNYDFSWASEIIPLVVSPFCEWVWSWESRFWIDAETPRILSAPEAVAFLKRTKSEELGRRTPELRVPSGAAAS